MSTAEQQSTAPIKPAKRRRRWLPSFGQMAAVVSLLGFGSLCFLAGAAAMYSGWSAAKPLAEGLQGATDWMDDGKKKGAIPNGPRAPHLTTNKAGRAADGFTLYNSTEAAEAFLYNTSGVVVHHWKMRPGVEWPGQEGLPPPSSPDSLHWEHCHLFPNGDLLALCCPGNDQPYGFGVVKVDKDSRLLWSHADKFHHDFAVGEDGRIYLLAQSKRSKSLPNLEGLTSACSDEAIVILSPEGKVLQNVSLLKSFVGTPYVLPLLSGNAALGGPGPSPLAKIGVVPGDVLHANSVRVLGKSMADKFPLFKEGQLLISLRTPSLLVVLDVPKQAVTWAAKGAWRFQHDAQFLDNGHLLLFDNLGTSIGSRVLEYDPASQAVPWSYGGTRDTAFTASFRGRCQRLPNGNTRIIDPERKVFEITPDKEIVWQFGLEEADLHPARNITGATVYRRDELAFLSGVPGVRPQ